MKRKSLRRVMEAYEPLTHNKTNSYWLRVEILTSGKKQFWVLTTPVHMPRVIGSVFYFCHRTLNFSDLTTTTIKGNPTSTLNNIEETSNCCLCLCVCDQTKLHQVMEALTSSCSKVIVDRLGSYPPRGAAYVSDRIQFCFSSNEKKGCNFQFLKLGQNKCINLIHAVPSKTQVSFFFFFG